MGQEIISVGIDIGTSTTKMVFSVLTLKNLAPLSGAPQVRFTSKKVIYRGAVRLTPLLTDNKIDGNEIARLISREYSQAGILPSNVSTGAVIITGEAAKRENARVVTEQLSGFAGDFVVAAAGPDIESLLSGKGAGTLDISKREGIAVANFDIGGGTTNVSAFRNGRPIGCACLDIGGRLVRFKANSQAADYVSPKLTRIAEAHGIKIEAGIKLGADNVRMITELMAHAIEELLKGGGRLVDEFTSPGSSAWPNGIHIDAISFSGGVGSCYYGKNTGPDSFNDIGSELAEALRRSSVSRDYRVIEPDETARATVIGAGCHSTQLSGGTVSFNRDVFPLRNLPVLRLAAIDPQTIASSLRWLLTQQDCRNAAIAWDGTVTPGFAAVQEMADMLISGADAIIKSMQPLVVLVGGDYAKALGQSLNSKLLGKYPVVCLDGVDFAAADYIDLGKPMFDGATVPVIVKSLIFSQEGGSCA